MTPSAHQPARVAIACGGTGGHLFPGLAVAGQLQSCGAAVSVLISPKEVDQQAVKSASGVEVFTLPAVALQRGSRLAFVRGFLQSWSAAQKLFRQQRPDAVLAMGGFTAAPPVLAARSLRIKTFLHESNTIPGKANRWLARVVDIAFVGFAETEGRLAAKEVVMTGTPVRAGFQSRDAAACRAALGLEPTRPVMLVMGGSQGASGINNMILGALPVLARHAKQWQWLHLTGPQDVEKVRAAYAKLQLPAAVHPFLAQMDLVLGAATASVSRAGASSLAELAAVRLPALLVPFPTAADNHQWHNARAFEETGAAQLLEQREATPEKVATLLRELMDDVEERAVMKKALANWHAPKAAEQIATAMLQRIGITQVTKVQAPSPNEASSAKHQLVMSKTLLAICSLALLGSGALGVGKFFIA
jgi:UDP-N-acetylglucosamine--N-acetylmuramyl-(pentapeptide) pyrophosphoryl-undecaprenol N-acetylglucosamine transferase